MEFYFFVFSLIINFDMHLKSLLRISPIKVPQIIDKIFAQSISKTVGRKNYVSEL